MSAIKTNRVAGQLFRFATVAAAALLAHTVQAAVPGITGPAFNLDAAAAYITQPDGASLYAWGYGCTGAQPGFLPNPVIVGGANCQGMQLPGPTLIVNQGDTVS